MTPYLRYGCVFGLFICDIMEGFVIFIKSWDNPKFVYLVELAIENGSQGKGNGYYLLLQSLLYLKNRAISIVGITVDPNNSQARHLYCDKLGFEIVEYRENEYGNGRDRLFLKLNLENWSANQFQNHGDINDSSFTAEINE